MRDVATRLGKRSLAERIVGLFLVTWIPMCVLSLVQGNAIAPTPRGSFLLDFATYARFFVAAPLLIIAERSIGPRIDEATHRFAQDGLVGPEDQANVREAIQRLTLRRASRWATAVLLILALVGGWNFTIEHIQGLETSSWQDVSIGEHTLKHSLAGTWNHLVAVPILLFLLYRWLWHLLVWSLFLRSVARLNLQLIPAHADSAGGLGFLPGTQSSFAIIAFGLNSVLSAEIAFRIVYEGAQLRGFEAPFVIILVVVELLFLGPLLAFTPPMMAARRRGMRLYGELVARYDRDFQRKWIDGGASPGEVLLGSPDIQSLADMGNSFEFVRRMRITPIDRAAVIKLFIATALPVMPLLLLTVPINDLFQLLRKLVL